MEEIVLDNLSIDRQKLINQAINPNIVVINNTSLKMDSTAVEANFWERPSLAKILNHSVFLDHSLNFITILDLSIRVAISKITQMYRSIIKELLQALFNSK